jgi:BASS family bile acid:Na+ symporter
VNRADLIRILTAAALVAIMLSQGMRVKLADVVHTLRNPLRLGLGVVANFALVPAATLALLAVFRPDPLVCVGFLLLAVCPGAPVGPPFVGIARGDVPAAIGQMVVLAALSVVLAPALLAVLLPRFVPDSDLRIDYVAIVRSLLVAQIVPLAAGLAFQSRFARLAERLSAPLGSLATVLLLAVVGLVIGQEFQSLSTIRWQAWLGMLLLLLASLAIGWLCGGPGPQARKTLALTTAVRNAAVALVIATANFAGTPAMTAVVACSLVSIFGTLGCAILLGRSASSVEPPSLSSSVAA